MRRGNEAYAQKRYREALDQWYNALIINKNDSALVSLIGKVEGELRSQQANLYLKDALEFYGDGKLNEAYASLKKVLEVQPMWESVAQEAGIDPKDITSGFDEGKKLLLSDNKRSSELGVNASPTFIWEGRRIIPGIKALSSIPGFEKVTAGTAAKKQVPAGACK